MQDAGPDAGVDEAAAPAQRPAPRRNRTVRDLVVSMGVVGIAVLGFAALGPRDDETLRTVDPAPVMSAAAQQARFPVLVPAPVPPGWQATSARVEGTADQRVALHVGWVTRAQQYAGLEESDSADVHWLASATVSGQPTGESVVLSGRTWQRYVDDSGRQRSLVSTARVPGGDRTATYVVQGSAGWPELEQLATALRPA